MAFEVTNNLLAGMNPGFEVAPAFVAATSTSARWIDGSAAGSAALSSAYKWAIISGSTAGATRDAQFDSAQKHSGTYSLKLSTRSTGTAIEVGNITALTVPEMIRHGIPVASSTAYIGYFWMKTSLTSGTSNDGAFMNFAERSVSAGAVASNFSTKVKTTTDWTVYRVAFTTGATTKFVVPRCGIVGNTGTATLQMDAWFDDITFAPVAALTRTARP